MFSLISTWRRRLIVSVVTGSLLAGIGILLDAIGGWGPCGPASLLSVIGAILAYHYFLVYQPLDAWASRNLYPDQYALLAFSLSMPTWSILTFAALSFLAQVKREQEVHRST